MEQVYNIINFDNIEKFISAVDITNEQICTVVHRPNQFICNLLLTGSYRYLSKDARKVLKKVYWEELLLDIQLVLLMYDKLENEFKEVLIQAYGQDYWNLLYNNILKIEDTKEFVQQYINNFNDVLKQNSFGYNNIIYWALNESIEYHDYLIENYIKPNLDILSNIRNMLGQNSLKINVKTKRILGKRGII